MEEEEEGCQKWSHSVATEAAADETKKAEEEEGDKKEKEECPTSNLASRIAWKS